MSLTDAAANPWSDALASNVDNGEEGGWADFDSLTTETGANVVGEGAATEPGGGSTTVDNSGDKDTSGITEDVAATGLKQDGETDDEELFECASDSLPSLEETDGGLCKAGEA